MPALLLAQLPIPSDPKTDPATRFAVASIRPDDGIEPARFRIQPSARVDITDASVHLLLQNAFRVRREHVLGVPDWADRERYAISATANTGTPVSAVPTMLNNLLADRFKLVAHREPREMQTFDLLLARTDARLGPALTVTSAECQAMVTAGAPASAAPGSPPDRAPCGALQMARGLARASGVPVAQLVRMLSQLVGYPVNDKTGLDGLYDLTLRFNPDMAADAAVANPDLPHLFTALPEQAGLRLVSQRGVVEVVVVDRIERPTPD